MAQHVFRQEIDSRFNLLHLCEQFTGITEIDVELKNKLCSIIDLIYNVLT